ncbi:MAG: DUF4905 domain-containing protein [Melioribacter sp.]|nr:DUF4905 domain-containing protein [Melioribacter sp.]
MKIKKYFNYDFQNQIWRILISDKDKLIIETRNPDTKEAFYNCFDIHNKNFLFTYLQFDEKYYIGIDAIYKEIIYLHKFPKPDLPYHKEIIAFDINSQKILWINKDLSFLFPYENRIYAFKQGFEERYFFALNYLTGELLEDLGNDYKTINFLRAESEKQKKYDHYLFPERYFYNNNNISQIIDKFINNLDIIGHIEYGIYKNIIMLSYHTHNRYNTLTNNFMVIDLDKNKNIITEKLNSNTKSFITDSFFMYKNFLILLKEKNGIIIYKLE